MKYKKIVMLACLSMITVVGILFSLNVMGRTPFAKLSVNDVASATVRLIPPDKTVQVMEIKELVDALNEVVVYRKDDSYTEYEGQAVIYTITLNDGKQIVVNAYNPFIIIDGVGYKTKYEPCERLSQIANRLVA